MKKKLLSFAAAALVSVCGMAQTWTWTGEDPTAGGDFYIYHPNSAKFLNHQNKTGNNLSSTANADEAFVWNVSNVNGTSSPYTIQLKSGSYWFNLAKSNSSANPNLSSSEETTQLSLSSTNTNINAYKIHRTANPARYLNYNGTSFTGAQSTGEQNDWCFISSTQAEAYNAYIKAYNIANNVNPSAIQEEWKTANINDAAEKTTSLKSVLSSLPNNTDLTSLIVNPGFESTASWDEGWTVAGFVKQSGNSKFNGNFAEMYSAPSWGWGKTAGEISQTIINIPNGVYQLSAKAIGGVDGDVLFANNVETSVPNNGDNEQVYTVDFNVYNGSATFGFKRKGADWWSAVDDFTLKYVGPLTANAGDNITSWCGQWTANQGNGPKSYSTGVETYGSDGGEHAFVAGKVLSQNLEGVPNGYYDVQFYACANMAWQAWATGANIAEVYANDAAYGIEVISQKDCTPETDANLHTFVAHVTNGTLSFGIQNVATGGNWYVAQLKSLTYLGTSAPVAIGSNLSAKAGKYGTFVAPYEVTLPSGITAYTAEIETEKVMLNETGSATLPANTPVIIKNTTGSDISQDYAGESCYTKLSTVGTGLIGVLKADVQISNGDYVLQTKDGVQQFYQYEGDPFAATKNRCYIAGPAPVKVLSFDGEETAIEEIFGAEKQNGQIYDLNGRRVSKPGKGIYVVNGKKVLF